MELYLIRHGKTYANVEHRLAGHTDVDLTPDGVAELELYAAEGTYPRPERIYTSDMTRTRRTRHILFPDPSIPVFEVPGLREIHFGAQEDIHLSPEDSRLYFDRFMANSLTNGGENVGDFLARIHEAFDGVVAEVQASGSNQRWAIVGHYGVLRAILIRLGVIETKEFFRDSIPNGLGYRILYDSTGGVECSAVGYP